MKKGKGIVYEVWHGPSSNLIVDFDSLKDAYDYIKYDLNGVTEGLRIDGADYNRGKFWTIKDWSIEE